MDTSPDDYDESGQRPPLQAGPEDEQIPRPKAPRTPLPPTVLILGPGRAPPQPSGPGACPCRPAGDHSGWSLLSCGSSFLRPGAPVHRGLGAGGIRLELNLTLWPDSESDLKPAMAWDPRKPQPRGSPGPGVGPRHLAPTKNKREGSPPGVSSPRCPAGCGGHSGCPLTCEMSEVDQLEGVSVNPGGSRGPAPKPLAHLGEGVSGDKETDPGSQLLWFPTAHGSPGPSETPVQGPQEGGRDSLGLMGGRETGRMNAAPSAVPASIPLPRSAPRQALGQRGWS